MSKIEDDSIQVINDALKGLPTKNLKLMELHWEIVGSDFLPFLKVEFYKDEEN